jgi:hypothetical protein
MSENTTNSYLDEIQRLQQRIIELERQRKEKEENDKKESTENNFNVINNLLTERKAAIVNNRYTKSFPLAGYYDQQLVSYLEPIYNILQNIDSRLKKLEQN